MSAQVAPSASHEERDNQDDDDDDGETATASVLYPLAILSGFLVRAKKSHHFIRMLLPGSTLMVLLSTKTSGRGRCPATTTMYPASFFAHVMG